MSRQIYKVRTEINQMVPILIVDLHHFLIQTHTSIIDLRYVKILGPHGKERNRSDLEEPICCFFSCRHTLRSAICDTFVGYL